MDILEFRDYCLSLPMSEECTPFDETTLVYKIGGKMYAYAGMENFTRFAVKCDPDRAVELRERYREITPAWHRRPPRSVSARADPPLLPAGPAAERRPEIAARGDSALHRRA